MTFTPSDDRPHARLSEHGWSETWGFELAGADGAQDGLQGMVRLTLRPEIRRAWYWLQIIGPELGIVVVRDEDVALPKRVDSLEVRGDGLWAELVCETPFEHWGVALEAFGLRVDTTDDDVGDRLPVGLDLEWELTGEPAVIEVADGTRYTQVGVIRGELLIDDERIEHQGPCTRDHAWGHISLPRWP